MPIEQPISVGATLVAAMMLMSACADNRSGPPEATPVFIHELAASATPWTHEEFDVQDGKFTFGLFSDLTGGEREHIFEVAVAQLSLLRPELIMNVGDLIEGGTGDRNVLSREWDSFDARARRATAPVFYTGGNHDLTNMTMREVWEERYGERYYHFTYKNVLFLILDTEDYTPEHMQEVYLARAKAIDILDAEGWDAFNKTEYASMPEQKTGEVGPAQSEYFQRVIADRADVRWTFLFMHKPIWRKENGHRFEGIEAALSDRPYTVFAGHFHQYRHEQRHGRDYIQLGTTGGVQIAGVDLSIDHLTLVTVSNEGVDIANLRMSGIFDKTGHIPLGGDDYCYDAAKCGEGVQRN